MFSRKILWALLISVVVCCGCAIDDPEKTDHSQQGRQSKPNLTEQAQEKNQTIKKEVRVPAEMKEQNAALGLNSAGNQLYIKNYIVNNETTDIEVQYPQIKGMSSKETEDRINQHLQDVAMNYVTADDLIQKKHDYFKAKKYVHLEVKIQYYNSRILSVQYDGYRQYGRVVPIFNVINIDLTTGKDIALGDLFSLTCFKEKLNPGVFMVKDILKNTAIQGASVPDAMLATTFGTMDSTTGDQDAIVQSIKNMDDDGTLLLRQAQDNVPSLRYFFKERHLYIIVSSSMLYSFQSVATPIPGSYRELQDCMNLKNGFWNDLLSDAVSNPDQQDDQKSIDHSHDENRHKSKEISKLVDLSFFYNQKNSDQPKEKRQFIQQHVATILNMKKKNAGEKTNTTGEQWYMEQFVIRNTAGGENEPGTDIELNYPQIKNMSSAKIQKQINQTLREHAMVYVPEEDVIEGHFVEVNVAIEYFTSKMLSVTYYISTMYNRRPQSDHVEFVHLDLTTGEEVTIGDLFAHSCYRKKLNRNAFSQTDWQFHAYDSYEHNGEKVDQKWAEDFGMDSGELMTDLYKRLSTGGSDFYFSENRFHVVVVYNEGSHTFFFSASTPYPTFQACINE